MCNYHRPVCASCRVEMRPETNDVQVLDVADWGPYQLWSADLWKCPICGKEIIIGFGNNAYAAHYEENFELRLQSARQGGRLYELEPA